MIENTDQRSKDYGKHPRLLFSPAHADYTYGSQNYGFRDIVVAGSFIWLRETAMRVAAGAIAKKYFNSHWQFKFKLLNLNRPNQTCRLNEFEPSYEEMLPLAWPRTRVSWAGKIHAACVAKGDLSVQKITVIATKRPCPVSMALPVFWPS